MQVIAHMLHLPEWDYLILLEEDNIKFKRKNKGNKQVYNKIPTENFSLIPDHSNGVIWSRPGHWQAYHTPSFYHLFQALDHQAAYL